ncbi:hypothetical protein PPAR_b0196 [Pseudoalteromonas paragorgicola KMM 3548]|nr:hypothetical protein [Pseudoalteromonas distincta KMM 3548]
MKNPNFIKNQFDCCFMISIKFKLLAIFILLRLCLCIFQ